MLPNLRRLPCSPPADPLENDDLLDKILLRLPPLPSSLPRASAVCKRWRGIASEPRFSRRFRAHHRRNPPLLGCFAQKGRKIHFQAALEAPNRVPRDRFSFPIVNGDRFVPLGCRHGLVLSLHCPRKQLLVWDPVIGDRHFLDIPPGFGERYYVSGAVLRAAGDIQHFEVVLVGTNQMQQALASVYSSKTGIWGNLTTAPLPPRDPAGISTWIEPDTPAVMVGDSLYWLLIGNFFGILQFDLGTQNLGLILMPQEETFTSTKVRLIMAEGGGLGLLRLSGFSVQLWKRETNCDGVSSWLLGRSIALDKLLSINSEESKSPLILAFAEVNNSVLLWTSIGIFTVQLESLKFKKLFKSNTGYIYFPFEGVYTADKGIGGGHDGAELLQNA